MKDKCFILTLCPKCNVRPVPFTPALYIDCIFVQQPDIGNVFIMNQYIQFPIAFYITDKGIGYGRDPLRMNAKVEKLYPDLFPELGIAHLAGFILFIKCQLRPNKPFL